MRKDRSMMIAVVAPILVWIFPVFFLYTQNVKEMQIQEIFKPCCIFMICGFAFILIGKLFFGNTEAGGLFSLLNGLLLGNFSLLLALIQKVIPALNYWYLLIVVLLTTIVACKIIVYRVGFIREILSIGIIVVALLMVFDFSMCIPTLITKIEISQRENAPDLSDQKIASGKRNIYFFLCDEYASFAQLEKDFNYTNSNFKTKLQTLGFNISETSNNDSCRTDVVLANIMQLDYIADDDTVSIELEKLTKNGLVHKILRENGYELRGIGNTNWLGIDGTAQSADTAVTSDGMNTMQITLGKSFLSIFVKRNYSIEALEIINTFSQINQIDIVPDASVFTMFYVCAPHHPYYLKEDGSMNDPDKFFNYDGKNNDSYIGELEYINQNLLSALKRIIKKDPNAIIVLCSDHGNRFGSVSEGMPTRILNTLYYHGEIVKEFEGMSSVNTLRYIFNKEFGTDFSYINLPDKE